ncbi:MAG TPA: ATPase [Methanoregulaceae archaeon]|nr:ATPase [Methanoregulaceae archaeon]
MKTEVLTDIKKAEEEYKAMIQGAEAERRKSIANAELEADNLVTRATASAEEYRKKCLADARTKAAENHTRIVTEGEHRAASLREQGYKNLDRAVGLLVSRFKEQLHVKG